MDVGDWSVQTAPAQNPPTREVLDGAQEVMLLALSGTTPTGTREQPPPDRTPKPERTETGEQSRDVLTSRL